MVCNHCLTAYHPKQEDFVIGRDADSSWAVISKLCPTCKRFNLELVSCDLFHGAHIQKIHHSSLIRPKSTMRIPPPKEVPQEFLEDYLEACLVLSDSPKASAALSRRCLQHLLREKAQIKPGNLDQEIQQLLDSGKLPSYLAESLDSVRNIGNFAAHPMKCKTTGEILPVEPGEAEWNLEVIESLFDFFFVQPEILKQKRAALNQKLEKAGKPPMK
jgi:hypothetical protein